MTATGKQLRLQSNPTYPHRAYAGIICWNCGMKVTLPGEPARLYPDKTDPVELVRLAGEHLEMFPDHTVDVTFHGTWYAQWD